MFIVCQVSKLCIVYNYYTRLVGAVRVLEALITIITPRKILRYRKAFIIFILIRIRAWLVKSLPVSNHWHWNRLFPTVWRGNIT